MSTLPDEFNLNKFEEYIVKFAPLLDDMFDSFNKDTDMKNSYAVATALSIGSTLFGRIIISVLGNPGIELTDALSICESVFLQTKITTLLRMMEVKAKDDKNDEKIETNSNLH